MDAIKLNSKKPIYIQIAEYFQLQVFIGNLTPGEIIPSRREIATSFRVNLNTVQKSYSYMEEIGLILTKKNKFSIITEDEQKIDKLKAYFLEEPIRNFIDQMKLMNIDKNRILALIDIYYDKDEKEYGGSDDRN
ncbi:GntR family transcriptional regulator [Peptostreptococcus equinus]|uniref:GntR family transcriptional regulator n=1 Tax=Peptostreptococcus equinus TaxID=3003601 RepID=A0ABY7JVN4_9FIRM|nr:GntR family transcriptional regulator [Peptostreptococcus sp. CBA3647]WAW15772.1 GntR family transcriptional regulator [Peptostreptococcus sp. CBA3647]